MKSRAADSDYAETINRAAMMLLAMCFRPDLELVLVGAVTAAVEARGGRIDKTLFIKFDLKAVTEDIADRAMAILSAALRQRLPGIADEMDEAFGDRLRFLLGRVAQLFPTS